MAKDNNVYNYNVTCTSTFLKIKTIFAKKVGGGWLSNNRKSFEQGQKILALKIEGPIL